MANTEKNDKDVKSNTSELSGAAQVRVAIAQDVLDRLASKQARGPRLRAESGQFYDGNFGIVDDAGAEARELIAKASDCMVCAAGGMFISAVMLNDAVKVCELMPEGPLQRGLRFKPLYSKLLEYLSRFFDEEQLMLIEMAFEGGRGYYGFGSRNMVVVMWTDEREEATRWWSRYCNDGIRMEHIMLNVVRNGGTFVPSDLPPRTW